VITCDCTNSTLAARGIGGFVRPWSQAAARTGPVILAGHPRDHPSARWSDFGYSLSAVVRILWPDSLGSRNISAMTCSRAAPDRVARSARAWDGPGCWLHFRMPVLL